MARVFFEQCLLRVRFRQDNPSDLLAVVAGTTTPHPLYVRNGLRDRQVDNDNVFFLSLSATKINTESLCVVIGLLLSLLCGRSDKHEAETVLHRVEKTFESGMSVIVSPMILLSNLPLIMSGQYPYNPNFYNPCAFSAGSHMFMQEEENQPSDGGDQQPDTGTPLRFSVTNILKPEFGLQAILSSKTPKRTTARCSHNVKTTTVAANNHEQTSSSLLSLPRDLSLSSTRLSPNLPNATNYAIRDNRDTFSTHCELTSPLQRHSSTSAGLSRSGSVESLASSRSSATSTSVVTRPSSLCSASSAISGECLSGESAQPSSNPASASAGKQNATDGQSLWPAWVYCTRYSDRPSSGT